jgi:GDP-L-fucose synthase
MLVLEKYNGDNIILSVPENNEISIKDVATIIAKCFNYEDRLHFDTNYSDGQYKKTVSTQKLMDFCPNYKFTDINNGISDTVKWFIDNLNDNKVKI